MSTQVFRRTIRRIVPAPVRHRITRYARRMLDGPPPEALYRPFEFAPDPSQEARLTLLLPALSERRAFGGVLTAVDFFAALARRLSAMGQLQLRILTESPVDETDSLLNRFESLKHTTETRCIDDLKNQLPTRRSEMYIAFNWWQSLNIETVLRAQKEYFSNVTRIPKIHLIQEYEPGFYPFSSGHLLAWQSYNSDWPLWGVFNSSELHSFFMALESNCERSYVFEPRLNRWLEPYRSALRVQDKKRTILAYGRPHSERNCFALVVSALRAWSSNIGATSGVDWQVVSAGQPHEDIDLGSGRRLESAGKLSIEEYGKLLQKASIGISLMATPHPSYPPLEMAHFGLRTLTNRYAMKNLSGHHDNIVSLDDVRPEAIARTLAEVCSDVERHPGRGLDAQSHVPDYTSLLPYECLEELAADIRAVLWH